MTYELKMFFDTEFTGLYNGTKLLSIGAIITYLDKSFGFYAECTDHIDAFPSMDLPEETKKFIEKHVIRNLIYTNMSGMDDIQVYEQRIIPELHNLEYTQVIDTYENCAMGFRKWIVYIIHNFIKTTKVGKLMISDGVNPLNMVKIVPVSDVMYYDMVLLMDFVKKSVPDDRVYRNAFVNAFVPFGHDIAEDIRTKICPFEKYYEAFDESRLSIIEYLYETRILSDEQLDFISYIASNAYRAHNSFYDALAIYIINKLINE